MSTEGRFPPEPTTAAIVLSRQPLRPCGLTPWVTKVVEAATWIRQQNLTLLSSLQNLYRSRENGAGEV